MHYICCFIIDTRECVCNACADCAHCAHFDTCTPTLLHLHSLVKMQMDVNSKIYISVYQMQICTLCIEWECRDHKLHCCWRVVLLVYRQPAIPLCATNSSRSRKNLNYVHFGHFTTKYHKVFVFSSVCNTYVCVFPSCFRSSRSIQSTSCAWHQTTFPADIVVELQITQFGYNPEMLIPHNCTLCVRGAFDFGFPVNALPAICALKSKAHLIFGYSI